MNVTLENLAACRRKLTIEIPADEVALERKSVIKEFQKFAQIPGFRPGKAPVQMIEGRFSKEIVEEVKRKLVPQAVREAIAKEKLDVVGYPGMGEVQIESNGPMKFDITLDVAPTFDLPNYKGLKVKKQKAEVTDQEVEDSLKLLADHQATFEDVHDRALEMGDFGIVSYKGSCDGKPLAEVVPAAKHLSENQQFWLLMGKDSFAPGFCDALVGAKKDEKREVSVEFPADYRIKDLSGKKVVYSVELQGIKQKKLPVFDDEFAKKYGSDSLNDLRSKVKENMLKRKQEEAESDVENQVVDQLMKATNFDLPESVVNAETQNTVMDIVRSNTERGIGTEMLKEKGKEIFDHSHQSAKDKVKSSFILGKIADTEKLTVSDEEIEQNLKEIADSSGQSVDQIRTMMNKREDGKEILRERILISKTIKFIVSQAVEE